MIALVRPFALLGLAAILVSGCSSPTRLSAVPAGRTTESTVPGIPDARYWPGDPASMQRMVEVYEEEILKEEAAGATVDAAGNLPPAYFLAVSGGGDDGAFGAGLLVGWTEHGDRPTFKLVTGVSTGALTAPFAFLGPDYDDELKAVYTTISSKDIYTQRGFLAAFFNDALSDTTPLHATIAKYVTEEFIADIADAYADGRVLLIATTDIDARRAVIWDIGAIASSSAPNRAELIQRILVASAAVPGAFPPVMIDVEVDGQPYQEMHVDGGAMSQVFIYPESLLRLEREEYGVQRQQFAYIIRNARLDADWASVERNTLDIAGRAISALIEAQGIGDLDRMYIQTQDDQVDYNLAYIGRDFTATSKEDFDQAYMNLLFDYGYQLGRAGYAWQKTPPGFGNDQP